MAATTTKTIKTIYYTGGTNAVEVSVTGNYEALRTITAGTSQKIAPKGTLSNGDYIELSNNGNVTLTMGNGSQFVTDFRNAADTIYTNNGGDTLWDKRGWDPVTNTKLASPITGSGGDTFFGGNGKDFLYDYGNATMGSYSDILFGNNGADYIWGGNGKDVLIGGQAGDLLYDAYGTNYTKAVSGTDSVMTSFAYFTKSTTNSVSDSTYTYGVAVAEGVYAPWDVIWGFDLTVDKLDFWGDNVNSTWGPNLKAATGMSLKDAAAANGGILTWLGEHYTDLASGSADPTRAFGIWQNDDTGTLGSNAIDQFVYVDIDGDGKADAKIQVNVGLDLTDIIVGHQIGRPALALVDDTGFSHSDKYTSNPGVYIVNYNPLLTYKYSLDAGATWHAMSGNTFYVDPNAAGDDDGTLEKVKVQVTDGVVAANSPLFQFTLDTYVDTPTVSLANDTGDSASDNYSKDGTLSMSAIDGAEPQTPTGAFTRVVTLNGVDQAAGFDGSSLGDGSHDGNYTAVVTDMDKAGNAASSTEIAFTVDTHIVQVAGSVADSAPATAVADGHPELLTDGLTNDETITITSATDTWDMNDSTSVAHRDYYVDSDDGDTTNGAHYASYPPSMADGKYIVTVTDSDLAGNTSELVIKFELDTYVPIPTIDGDTNGDPVFSSTPDDLYSRMYSIDGGSLTSTFDITSLGSGSHTVTVTDTDNAGNDETSDPFEFTVATPPPPPPPPPTLAGTWVVSNSTDAHFSMDGLLAVSSSTEFTGINGVNTAQGTVNFNVNQDTGTATLYYTGTDDKAYYIDVIIYDTADQGQGGSLVLDVGAFAGDYDQSYIKGGQAGDSLTGTDAIDTFIGGNGNDVLQGDLSNDTLTGGQGSDTFVYADLQDALDLITDFNDNGNEHDKIDLSAITSGHAERISFSVDGNETTVKIDNIAIVVVVMGNASDPLTTGGTSPNVIA